MATENLTAAATILAQLGGSKFVAMTGAKNLLGGADSLQFKLGAGAKDGITHCRIVLDDSDTYTVSFFRVRGANVTNKGETSLVYNSNLRTVFEAATGFRTSL